MIDRLGGVRLSEKARGAAARPALCKSARRGGASGSGERAARRRVRLSKKARSTLAGRGGADRSLEGVGGGGG